MTIRRDFCRMLLLRKLPALLIIAPYLVHAIDDDETCPLATRERLNLSPGKHICCSPLIRNLVNSGIAKFNLVDSEKILKQKLSTVVQILQKFVHDHFGIAFEVIMAPKDFALNTHYNGTTMCKFDANGNTLAVYATPGKYDIKSQREQFFSNFALNDAMKLRQRVAQLVRGTFAQRFEHPPMHPFFG